MYNEEGSYNAASATMPLPPGTTATTIPVSVPPLASWQQRPSQQPERPRTSSTSSIPSSQGGGGASTSAVGFGVVTEDISVSRSDPLDFLTGGDSSCELSEDEIRMISSSSAEASIRTHVDMNMTERSGSGSGEGGGSSNNTGQWMDCSDALDLLDNIQTPLLQAKTLLSDAALQSSELQREITAVLRSSMKGQTQVHNTVDTYTLTYLSFNNTFFSDQLHLDTILITCPFPLSIGYGRTECTTSIGGRSDSCRYNT